MRLNSIIFHTTQLDKVRAFYEQVLGLTIGTFEQEGETVSDAGDTYVNYDMGSVLLCFEKSASEIDHGTVVLQADDLEALEKRLTEAEVPIAEKSAQWLIFQDPDERTLIVEASS